MFYSMKTWGSTWNLEWNLFKFLEFFNSVSQLGSKYILFLRQQNEKKLRHPFCKTCSNFNKQRVWQNHEVSSKHDQLDSSDEPYQGQESYRTTYVSAILSTKIDVNYYDERQRSSQLTDISWFFYFGPVQNHDVSFSLSANRSKVW